jgi:bacillithiol biosynthesis cysteine-adding enzyme BshC
VKYQGLSFKYLKLDSNKLAADYLGGSESAARFFAGRWDDPGALKELAARLDKKLDRQKAARVLKAQRGFVQVENGEHILERFVAENGFIVTTGQQPVLFGGPLYVLYKCIDCIATAARYSKLLERPVLPVFWNASEDHDLLEASAISLPDQGNEMRTVSLDAPGGNYTPLCQYPLGPSLAAARSLLEEVTPDTDFRPQLLELIDNSFREQVDFGHAFSALLSGLFGPLGLFVVDACSPELRREAVELFERELFDAAASAELFGKTSAELETAGYTAQVKPQHDDTALFVMRDGRREKLQRAGGGFVLKGSGETLDETAVRGLLRDTPEVFSPGVRMRPLVEASLFGSLTYLAGPGEISYYAQMKPLYALRDLEMPLIAPRLSGVLVEQKIAKVLDKYTVAVADLEQGADKLAEKLIGRSGELDELTRQLSELRAELDSRLELIGREVDKLDPTMRGPVSSTGGAISAQLGKLEGKLTQAAKRRNELMLEQLGKAEVNLWPGGNRQERAISWLYYLVRYGDGLLGWLLECADGKN